MEGYEEYKGLTIKDSNGNEYLLVKKKETKMCYINIHYDEKGIVYTGVVHDSEEMAKKIANNDKYYVKTIKFELEV